MAYLPGVPDVNPTPVSISPRTTSTSIGKPQGIAALAHSAGKPSRTQHLGSVVGRQGAGISTGTGGNPALHSIGHYGKQGPPLLGGSQVEGGVDVTNHPGARIIRGEAGGMRSHIREGGLGPGKLSTPGPSDTDYSMNSSDIE